jgi:hypothetical protein
MAVVLPTFNEEIPRPDHDILCHYNEILHQSFPILPFTNTNIEACLSVILTDPHVLVLCYVLSDQALVTTICI